MQKRYIDAYRLRRLIKNHEIINKALALTLINSTHTEDTERHSEWELSSDNGKWWCKSCYHESEMPTKYCPNCGARTKRWCDTEEK